MVSLIKKYYPHIFLLLFIVLATYFTFDNSLITYLKGFATENSIIGALIFIALLIIATGFGPVTIFPLLPVFSALFGPLLTAIYSVIGWTLGAVLAFCIARYLGRPVIKSLVSLERLEKYERLLPHHAKFWSVVMLRMLIPADVLSYAIGALTTMHLAPYTLATLIGVTPFSFIFAYAGNAFYSGSIGLLLILSGISLAIFIAGYYIFKVKPTNTHE